MVLETSVLSIFNQLTRLEVRENFIKLVAVKALNLINNNTVYAKNIPQKAHIT
jgi:hypothetical protein